MDTSSGQGILYPLHRTKTLHLVCGNFSFVHWSMLCFSYSEDHLLNFKSIVNCELIQSCIQVRHAQGFHNVEGDKDPKAYLSYDLFDASLTPLGWKQVIAM